MPLRRQLTTTHESARLSQSKDEKEGEREKREREPEEESWEERSGEPTDNSVKTPFFGDEMEEEEEEEDRSGSVVISFVAEDLILSFSLSSLRLHKTLRAYSPADVMGSTVVG